MQASEFLLLWEQTIYRVLIIGLLGLLVGSFLNVIIYRLPLMLYATWRRDSAECLGLRAEPESVANLIWPRSFCPICHEKIRAIHLVPLLSFLILSGRCARCTAHIPWRYPVVEVLTGGLFAIVAWLYSQPTLLAGALLLTATLVALAFIDLDTLLLPDVLTQPLLWAGLLFHQFYRPEALSDAVLGAAIGYLFLWTLYWLFRLITGKHGMGQGDFKLLAALGAWLGWQMLPLVIVISSFTGVCVALVSIVYFKRHQGQAFPFGPYLAIAGWLAFVAGERIMNWYIYDV